MKRIALLLLATTIYTSVHAQGWEIHVAAGTSFGKLIPTIGSTPATSAIHYGFSGPGIFLSPELNIRVGEHSRVSMGYQLSSTAFGVQLYPEGRIGGREISYDVLTMHNFSVGYSYRQNVLKEHMVIGGFAKAGVVFGQMTAYGDGVSSGYSGANESYMSTSRLSDFEVIPDFWSPTATVGFIAGPNFKTGVWAIV